MDNENKKNEHGIAYKLLYGGCIAVLLLCLGSATLDVLDISLFGKDSDVLQTTESETGTPNDETVSKNPILQQKTEHGQKNSSETDNKSETDMNTVTETQTEANGQTETDTQASVASTSNSSNGSFEDELDHLYYYRQLSGDEKQIYLELLDSLMTRQDKVLTTLDSDSVDKVYQYVMNDHPEIFYTSGYNLQQKLRNDKIIQLTFKPSDLMSEQEIANNQACIDDYVKQCFDQMPTGLDQYGQVKYIYDYVVSNTDYELDCENNQNICSVFILKKSVCQGYSKAMQYLLERLGFNITLVFGEANGGAHTWNLIEVDGAYYYLDATWGDAGYLSSQESGYEGAKTQTVNYDYLLITTDLITKTHKIDDIVELPVCNSMTDNYYNREGLYFTQLDEDKMRSAFDHVYETGQNWVSVMCSDPALYESMKDEMINQQKVFDYMQSTESVSYTYNDDVMTLTFWLSK